MIYVDTREKKNLHIIRYFQRNNIPYRVKKLDECDYAGSQNNVLIERKQNLAELAYNITCENGRRIKAEFDRIPEGKKVYVLIEEMMDSLDAVVNWKGKYTKLHGATLYRYMVSYQRRHGFEYIFCHKNSSGRIIAELLGEEAVKHGKEPER